MSGKKRFEPVPINDIMSGDGTMSIAFTRYLLDMQKRLSNSEDRLTKLEEDYLLLEERVTDLEEET